jgi:glutathione synthase/RimK-type ligase-like ATP-grasp enzyme
MPQPTTATAPVLLVLGAGSQLYQAHCLERITAAHPTVLVDDSAPPEWAEPYIVGFLGADLRAADEAVAAVKEFAAERPVAGLMTYMEHHVELAARLAQDLGLPGMTPESAFHCRDKAETRRLLSQHRVPSARSYTADTEQDAVDAARLLGVPVVVKPRGLGGSAGVRRADNEAAVRAAYRAATSASTLGLPAFAVTGCLVEEYLVGEEVSAATVVLGPGRASIVAVARKLLGPEPTFLEVGHSVRAHDALARDPALQSVVRRTVDALGITSGLLHIELRLTDRGPRVIEVNARLGGDLIPRLAELALGIDLPAAAAALATGTEPDLTQRAASAAAIRFAYPRLSGRISELSASNPDETGLDTHEPWLDRLVLTQQLGSYVSAPPLSSIDDRLAHWVVQGPDDRAVTQRLDDIADRLVVAIDAPHVTACAR